MVTETQSVNATAVSPADSSMWIATSVRGLVRVGKNGKAFNYSVEKGDLACNNVVALTFDNEGVLWIKDAEGAVLSYTSFTGFVRQYEVPQSIAEALSEPVLVAEQEVAPQPKLASRPWFGSWWFLLLTILLLAYFLWRVYQRFWGENHLEGDTLSSASQSDPFRENAPERVSPSETHPKEVSKPKPAEPTPKPAITAPETGSFYDKVYTIVKDNYTNSAFGVEDVANALGMSRVHLNRKLKAENKPSPSDLIKKMRMDLAAGMLKEGSASISEIAAKCGFSSASYFSSAFKEYFGVAPAAYGK
jgi:AraC-like DNA-binding protein